MIKINDLMRKRHDYAIDAMSNGKKSAEMHSKHIKHLHKLNTA
jgi:hypothetical protein